MKDRIKNIISKEEYYKDFSEDKILKKALEYSLDIRKFEIDLYWKRATYFWAFIAANFAAYILLQNSSDKIIESETSLLIICLGMVFSLAWFLSNKGSKYWQNNWESHVDMLEDKVLGPLYKTIIQENNEHESKIIKFLTLEDRFSVTKINQILSFYIFIIWTLLFIKNYCFSFFSNILSMLTILVLIAMYFLTKSSHNNTTLKILRREIV